MIRVLTQLGRVYLYIYRRERRVAADHVGSPFGDHNDRRIDVASDEIWHHCGVDHAQTFDPANPQLRINHGHFVGDVSHPTSAKRVIHRIGGGADKGVELGVRAYIVPGCDLPAKERLEGRRSQ
jgi:hypothetical protein